MNRVPLTQHGADRLHIWICWKRQTWSTACQESMRKNMEDIGFWWFCLLIFLKVCLEDVNCNGCMKCELYVSAVLFLFSPQTLACYLILHDNHCYGRLSLWTLAAEKRSCTDDFTLFRVFAFGEYYEIANKLVLFNCSGMYAFPVPTVHAYS